MVFRNEEYIDFENAQFCGDYHPYRRHGMKNPNFDAFSGLMLDLKENKENALGYFRDFLEKNLKTDIPIAVVPSHDPAKTTSGVRTLAVRLAAAQRIDATGCLVRTEMIEKLSHGGNRDIQVHLNSIQVINEHLIINREVVLLDDIMTSGNSLRAGRQLLLQAGAKSVQMLALARTVQE